MPRRKDAHQRRFLDVAEAEALGLPEVGEHLGAALASAVERHGGEDGA